MVLIVMLMCLLGIMFAFLTLEHGDLLAPSVIVPMAFAASTATALYCSLEWTIDYSLSTCLILVMGVLIISTTAFLFNSTPRGSISNNLNIVFDVPLIIGLLSIIAFAVMTLLYYRALNEILAVIWETDWTITMFKYREYQADPAYVDLVRLPSYIRLMMTGMQAISMVYAYVVINNILVLRKLRVKDVVLALCVFLYIGASFLTGGRFTMMTVFLAVTVMAWIIVQRHVGWTLKIRPGVLVKLVVAMGAMLALFYISKVAVGRPGESSFIDDFSLYLGGSVINFDTFLKNPPPPATVFGQETFRGLISLLYRITGNQSLNFSFQLAHQYASNGDYLGNVYTAFRYWIYDFGFLGFILLSFFYGWFYACLYAKSKRVGVQNAWILIVYCLLFPSLVILFIQDQLLAVNFTVGGMFIIVCIFCAYKLIARFFMRVVDEQTGELRRAKKVRKKKLQSAKGLAE